MPRLISPLLLLWLLTACSPITVQHNAEGPVPVELRVDDAAYWLEEWHRTLQMAPDAYQQAFDARQQDYAERPDARSRLRLILLLVEGKSALRDHARALELLEGVEAGKASHSAKALAALLKNIITEQQQLSRSETAQTKNIEKKLKTARSKIKELEQQLHELTSIEQNIHERTKE